jgi:hypothetical protein
MTEWKNKELENSFVLFSEIVSIVHDVLVFETKSDEVSD